MPAEPLWQNAKLLISAGTARQFPSLPLPQIVLSGRSNVGKSSLINALLCRKALARVSGEPGKTVTVNFYDVDGKLLLADLPGYGFARRAAGDQAKWKALTDGFFTGNPNFDRVALVLQLIDLKVGPTADDDMMLDFLSENGIPFAVVATKADKLNKTERAKNEAALRAHPALSPDVPVIVFSAKSGEGRGEVLRTVLRAANLK